MIQGSGYASRGKFPLFFKIFGSRQWGLFSLVSPGCLSNVEAQCLVKVVHHTPPSPFLLAHAFASCLSMMMSSLRTIQVVLVLSLPNIWNFILRTTYPKTFYMFWAAFDTSKPSQHRDINYFKFSTSRSFFVILALTFSKWTNYINIGMKTSF